MMQGEGHKLESQLGDWKTLSVDPAINQGRIRQRKDIDGFHLSHAVPKTL